VQRVPAGRQLQQQLLAVLQQQHLRQRLGQQGLWQLAQQVLGLLQLLAGVLWGPTM
jgi:hypothetical protein